MTENNIPCDEITQDSWDFMPKSIRVIEFCNHCEFKCDNGKELIDFMNKFKN